MLYERIKDGDKAVRLSDSTVNVRSWVLGLSNFVRGFRRAYKMGGRFIPAVFFCLQVHGPTTGGAYKRKVTVVLFGNGREIRGTFNGFFIIKQIKKP